MIEFLIAAWKYRGLIGIGLAVAIVGAMFLQIRSLENDLEAQRLKVAQVTTERDMALDVASLNAAAVDKARQEREEILALAERVRADDAARQDAINTITKEVSRAKPSECPAGAGLSAAHLGLRKLVTETGN